jgi:hypothetical protein
MALPKELAPNLYRVTRYKMRSVCTELHNNNWIRSLNDMESSVLIEEFTLLFMALSSTQLSNQKDTIHWRWTGNEKFSTASAYECQFFSLLI